MVATVFAATAILGPPSLGAAFAVLAHVPRTSCPFRAIFPRAEVPSKDIRTQRRAGWATAPFRRRGTRPSEPAARRWLLAVNQFTAWPERAEQAKKTAGDQLCRDWSWIARRRLCRLPLPWRCHERQAARLKCLSTVIWKSASRLPPPTARQLPPPATDSPASP